MEPQKFIRRPFELEAVQVTPMNYIEVAKWCGGTAIETDYRMMGGVHKMGAILLPKQGPKANKTHTVLIGTWITKHRNQFRWWKLDQFEAQFSPAKDEFETGNLVRANNEIWAGWEGKVADPILVGVDFGARGMFVFEPQHLEKIDEMDSLQLELNAGVDKDPETSADPFAGMLDQMRQENKDKMAALEAENLEYDPSEIRPGDFVKVRPDPKQAIVEYQGQYGDVKSIDENGIYWVEFATADPDKPEVVPFCVEALEKVVQNDPTIDEEEPFDMAIPTYELQPDGVTAVPVEPEFEVNDLIETLVEHEFDGVTVPAGTNARVCVIGVEFVGEPGTDGIEVLFSDGHYSTFMPKDIKKV